MATSRHREGLRRYPALGFLAAAAGLALLLPSGLTVPSSGPSTLAELAPVPGEGDGTGDLSSLGEASSSGLGAGSRGPRGRGASEADRLGTPDQRRRSLKDCVGSPPRQTEDPLSPPCVAFFEGNNGGATSRGVTRDEVKVVALILGGSTAGRVVDYAEPASEDDSAWDFLMKVYARYFNHRYQAYNRYVHLYGLHGASGSEADLVERRRAEADRVDELGAFATVPLTYHALVPYVEETARRGIVTTTIDAFERDFHRRNAPLVWTVFPDLEDEAELAGSYVCRKLAGKDAEHSGNVDDRGRRRVFGIVYSDSAREPGYPKLERMLREDLERRCGVRVAVSVPASDLVQESQGQAPAGIARLRTEGVTTVILAARGQTVLSFTSSASAAGWFPEWFVPGRRTMTGVDQAANGRVLPQEQWRNAWGISYSPRWGDEDEMYWLRSYRETCRCPFNGPYYSGAYAYDALAMLFYGIQAAGPRLTLDNFDKGMHAIPPRPSRNAYTPAAYFTPGNFSYIKDAMEIWWDPSGQAPGAEGSPGCYRTPLEGRRFRAGEWPASDAELFSSGPCNGDAPLT